MTEGETYMRCLNGVRRFNRHGLKYRMLAALAHANDHGLWLAFSANRRNAITDNTSRLRADGWPIERGKVWHLHSWHGVRLCDLHSRNGSYYKKNGVKHAPPDKTTIYRLPPDFMREFRLWFYGARQSRLITMLTGKSYGKRAVVTMFRALKMWDLGVIATRPLRSTDED